MPQPNPTVHTQKIFNAILALDVVCLTTQLTVLVTDNVRYKRLVTCGGDSAQALLNVLQAVCDALFLRSVW